MFFKTNGNSAFRLNNVTAIENIDVSGEADYVYKNGVWSPNSPDGVATASDDILIFNSTSAEIVNNLTANNFEVKPWADVDIKATLSLSGDLTADGKLTFKSDDNNTAQLDEFAGTLTGDVTVERYIPAKRAFRLLSTSVTTTSSILRNWQENRETPINLGTHITGTGGVSNGFDPTTTNNSSMFTFDNTLLDQSSGAAWTAVPSTTTNLSAGTPYRLLVRGDRGTDLTNNEAAPTPTRLRSTGSMHTGDFSPTMATGADFFSFIGNPYQSVVDFGSVVANVATNNITGYLYIWDASIAGEFGNGGYTVIDASDGSEVTAESPYSSDANQFIPPGLAFFVKNTSSGNGSVTFEEADKTPTQSQVAIFSEYTNFYINSRLYKTTDLQNGYMESDAIGLRFSEDFTTLGSDEDAAKLGNPSENYAIENNGLRSIDKQGIPSDGHEVDLIIFDYETTNYSLTFTLGNTPENKNVYLGDAYLNTQTELADNTTYDFTVDTSIPESAASNRFKLVFEDVPLSQTDFTENSFSLYPNPALDILNIRWVTSPSTETKISIYNLLGQKVGNFDEISASEIATLAIQHLDTGIYVLQIQNEEMNISKKFIKR